MTRNSKFHKTFQTTFLANNTKWTEMLLLNGNHYSYSPKYDNLTDGVKHCIKHTLPSITYYKI